ncbi:hypothetical protein Taro_048371 [Colocasia esculenta]|uniref:Uncharacterized protein n=1 Tax=Colocasia esculenta TaxID=4460 RepID=A0A843X2R0_COLES|nr:hypothetical protein [Colocasia esculenta]
MGRKRALLVAVRGMCRGDCNGETGERRRQEGDDGEGRGRECAGTMTPGSVLAEEKKSDDAEDGGRLCDGKRGRAERGGDSDEGCGEAAGCKLRALRRQTALSSGACMRQNERVR